MPYIEFLSAIYKPLTTYIRHMAGSIESKEFVKGDSLKAKKLSYG